MKRDRFNIAIYRGESFSLAVELKDADDVAITLANATLTAQCRVKTTNVTLFTFSTSIVSPASGGQFLISLPGATSLALTPQKGLVYDVKIEWAGGDTKYWLGGDLEIIDTVSA